jgi:hypothetical protein
VAAAGSGFAAKGRAKARKQPRRQQQRRPTQQQQQQQEEGDEEDLKELSTAQHVITVPDFAPDLCQQLRQVLPVMLLPPSTIRRIYLRLYYLVDFLPSLGAS